MRFNVDVNEPLLATLTEIAKKAKLPAETYVSNIVDSFLRSQHTAPVIDAIRKSTPEEVEIFKAKLKK